MFKNALREIIIILLILLAVILILAVLLYKYIPSNKIIPEQISYTTSEPIKEELANMDVSAETDPIRSYQLTATDINNYKRIDSYVPGKVNPFSSYKKEVPEEDGNTTSSETSGTQTNSSNSGTTIPNIPSTGNSSEGTYLPNTGTK